MHSIVEEEDQYNIVFDDQDDTQITQMGKYQMVNKVKKAND
jgi:hypothetical protein